MARRGRGVGRGQGGGGGGGGEGKGDSGGCPLLGWRLVGGKEEGGGEEAQRGSAGELKPVRWPGGMGEGARRRGMGVVVNGKGGSEQVKGGEGGWRR